MKLYRDILIISNMKQNKPFIGLSGVIGSGKTTLARNLCEMMNLPLYLEPQTESEYGLELLDKFYKNQDKYGFAFQMFLLNERHKQQQQITWNGGGITDRTSYDDYVFSMGLRDYNNIDDISLRLHRDMIVNFGNEFRHPDLIVYLDVSPEICMERIKIRGRKAEKNMNIDFLRKLYENYEFFLDDISHNIPVARIKYENFTENEEDIKQIMNIINTELSKKYMTIYEKI